MLKKLLSLLCVLLLLLSAGCQNARQIETASVIENVSVQEENGQTVYTFYLLGDSARSEAVAVPARSFEAAVGLAERSYIPHLTLAKLELLLIERGVSREVLRRDIAYIAGESGFSPVARLALCDAKTLLRLRQKSSSQELIANQIDRLQQDNPQIVTDYLSVFNAYERGEAFSIPLITCEGDLKATTAVLF